VALVAALVLGFGGYRLTKRLAKFHALTRFHIQERSKWIQRRDSLELERRQQEQKFKQDLESWDRLAGKATYRAIADTMRTSLKQSHISAQKSNERFLQHHQRMIQYHSRLVAKYKRAARRPWESVAPDPPSPPPPGSD
jgi:hypothetical protein